MSRWTQFFALALACWLPLQSALAWLPVIIFYGSLAAVLFGAVPLFVLEYFACRRYLRRQAVPSPDHA